MPRMDETIQALVACPWERDLQFVWPFPRMDGVTIPFHISSTKLEEPHVLMKWSRSLHKRKVRELINKTTVDSDAYLEHLHKAILTRGDILWHQDSNVIVIIREKMAQNHLRTIALCAPDTPEELEAFNATEGVGQWCCVAQGWFPGEQIPTELFQGLPEMVGFDDPDVLDTEMGKPYREHKRMSWVAEGMIDPNFRPPSVEKYYKRQLKAMQMLTGPGVPDREAPKLPEPGDLEPGEVRITHIPFEEEKNG